MGQSNSPASPVDPSSFTYVVGIDIGSQNCSLCALKPDKSQVIKPTEFTNAPAGFVWLLERIERLGASPDQILIGLEATSRDARESLPLSRKPRVPALSAASQTNPPICPTAWLAGKNGQTGCGHDCSCLARDGEARRGYVPTDLIATYRELARLQTQLTEDVTRYRNEIHALLQVLFPEFRQVFADPCRPTALAMLKLYPSAGSMAVADVETIAARVA
jgi:transposase